MMNVAGDMYVILCLNMMNVAGDMYVILCIKHDECSWRYSMYIRMYMNNHMHRALLRDMKEKERLKEKNSNK